MSFELLKSKILDLFNGKDLTEKQKINSALVAKSLMSFRLAMWPKQVHTMNSSLAADQPVVTRMVRSDRLIGVLL